MLSLVARAWHLPAVACSTAPHEARRSDSGPTQRNVIDAWAFLAILIYSRELDASQLRGAVR